MTTLTGPLTNGTPNAGRTGAPFFTTDPEYFVLFDDFLFDVVTVSAAVHSIWTTTVDAGGTTLKVADAPNGVLQLSSGNTTENLGTAIQVTNNTYDFSSSNEGWFETRVMLTDADKTDVFAGFTFNFATDPEACLTAPDRIGFSLIGDSANWNCVTERSGIETRVVCDGTEVDGIMRNVPLVAAIDMSTATDPDDAAWDKLGIHIVSTNDRGAGVIEFYINDVKVCTTLNNIPDDVFLSMALMQLNGEAANNSMYVDYIYGACTR